MKILKKTNDTFRFHLASREKELLLQVLQLYPQVPATYQTLSKSDTDESKQRLLEEALAESRAENQKQLQALLSDPARLIPVEQHWVLQISESQIDWLLQVLNDIRVGSWIRLGTPESPVQALNSANAPHFWALELADYFQNHLLEALDD